MTHVAPRKVNDVSYVTRINHESDFSWQGQYLVKLHSDLVSPRNVNDVSCVATIKNERCSSIVFCIPEVARRNVNHVSYVGTIKRIIRL